MFERSCLDISACLDDHGESSLGLPPYEVCMPKVSKPLTPSWYFPTVLVMLLITLFHVLAVNQTCTIFFREHKGDFGT